MALCVGTAGRIPKVKVKQGEMFRDQPCNAVYSDLCSPSLLKDRLHRGRRDYSNQMAIFEGANLVTSNVCEYWKYRIPILCCVRKSKAQNTIRQRLTG